MSNHYRLRAEMTGFLKEVWISNQTAPFPGYGGQGTSIKLPGITNPIAIIGANVEEVLAACKHLEPDGVHTVAHIRPVVITHQNNVKLEDDEL